MTSPVITFTLPLSRADALEQRAAHADSVAAVIHTLIEQALSDDLDVSSPEPEPTRDLTWRPGRKLAQIECAADEAGVSRREWVRRVLEHYLADD